MNFHEEYILENERVRLTPLKEDDYNHLVHFALEEPELWTYSLIQASSAEKMKVYIDTAIEGRKNEHTYAFLVFDKLTNQYAGSTRFYDIQIENSAVQLGFTWYGKEFQGTGLNKNCKYLLLEFAFETLQLERVEFRADNENQRSINAMKRIGCTVEGILRSNSYKQNGKRRDSIVLSILKNEWYSCIKQYLKENNNSKQHSPKMEKFTVIYSFKLIEGKENPFIEAWTALTKLIYQYEGSYGSRLHKIDPHHFIGYAQWPDKATWKNSGDNLPESAAEMRKQMRESCSEIKTEFEMVEVVDLLNDKRAGDE